MSIGPPALGNILVQRLDAVLGTTMAAHANAVTGARPDAVTQPGEGARPDGSEHATRGPRQGVNVVEGGAGGRQNAIADAKTAAALALAARGLVTRTDLTASAPTTLGSTARTILAVLAQFPEKAPPVPGRAPLWTPAGGQADLAAAPSARPAGGQAGAPVTQGSAATASAADPELAPTGAQSRPAADAAQAGTPRAANAPTPAAQALQVVAPRADAPHPATLALALRVALQQSGLFYESHLTQMVYGQRTPQQLSEEPQAALRLPAGQPDNAPSTARQAADTPAPAREASQSAAGSASGSGSASPSGASSGQGQPLAGIHPEAMQLVRQQLDVLANQSVTWQGQAWPGTEMEWEVERDRTAGSPEPEEGHWATRIKLDLPRLGLVEARINLAGNQVVMHLVAPRSAAELGRNGDGLRQGLTSAGLTLSQLNVDVAPPSPFVFEP